jgi:hypothetical protein
MTFSLPGFDAWTFQVVMLGSLMVLEALHEDIKLSTVLEPMDSRLLKAHDLVCHPSCVRW